MHLGDQQAGVRLHRIFAASTTRAQQSVVCPRNQIIFSYADSESAASIRAGDRIAMTHNSKREVGGGNFIVGPSIPVPAGFLEHADEIASAREILGLCTLNHWVSIQPCNRVDPLSAETVAPPDSVAESVLAAFEADSRFPTGREFLSAIRPAIGKRC